MKQTTIVVLVYGLPGAGKTSLCEQIVEKAPQFDFATIHICYDRLLPDDTFRVGDWRSQRQTITEHVRTLLEWRRSLCNECCEHDTTTCPRLYMSLPSTFGVRVSAPSLMILLDDNFYYTSMRRAFYRLCRDYRVAYAPVHVNVTLQRAFDVNRERAKGAIPEDIIKRMNERADWVNNDGHETFTLGASLSAEQLAERTIDLLQDIKERAIRDDGTLIPRSFAINADHEADRQQTLSDAAHQFELVTRRCVASIIKEAEDKRTTSVLVQVAKEKMMKMFNEGIVAYAVGDDDEMYRDLMIDILESIREKCDTIK